MVRMTKTQLDKHLRKPLISNFSTIRPDGSPHIVPVWHHFDGVNVLILSETTSIKVRNIRHEARVAISIPSDEQHSGYDGYVQVNGKASLFSSWDSKLLWKMAINYMGMNDGSEYAEKTYNESEFILINLTPTYVFGLILP